MIFRQFKVFFKLFENSRPVSSIFFFSLSYVIGKPFYSTSSSRYIFSLKRASFHRYDDDVFNKPYNSILPHPSSHKIEIRFSSSLVFFLIMLCCLRVEPDSNPKWIRNYFAWRTKSALYFFGGRSHPHTSLKRFPLDLFISKFLCFFFFF